jgi:hypothetical protein
MGAHGMRRRSTIVKNRIDLPFTLTPQRDRRQQSDRRLAWRGGRRAADHVCANVVAAPDLILWTSLLAEAQRLTEKPILH